MRNPLEVLHDEAADLRTWLKKAVEFDVQLGLAKVALSRCRVLFPDKPAIGAALEALDKEQ